MLRNILTLSALILALLLVRAVFRNRVPKRMLYALWLVVLLKLCLPGTLVSLPVLPAQEAAAPMQRTELPAQTTAPTQQPMQQPVQAVVQPQEPAQQPVSPAQESLTPAKPLTAAQIFQIVWLSGSVLLGLWLSGSWLMFTLRLHKSRRFLGKRGRTRIYVSDAVNSPCLAGLLPAVYLTQDVLQTEEAELILRHELTHLHHLDFLWSFCRAAAVAVYWWNPLVWLAAICSKRDAELACDEAVAAGLDQTQRLAYARAILAQAPRRTAALSLAGPPVKERILFLTKKQHTSAVCVVLALLLVVSATGCSFAELTQKKSGKITMPTDSTDFSSEATPQPVDSTLPVMDTLDLPAGVAEWVSTYLSAQYAILDAQTVYFDGSNYVLLLISSENPSVTGYQLFALEQKEATYSLYAWNESHGWDPSLENMVCTMYTDAFAAAYGFTKCSDPSFDMLALTLEDGNEESVSIEPDTPFLYVISGRLKRIQNMTLSNSGTNTNLNIGRGWNERPKSDEDAYPMNDSIWSRVHEKLDSGRWAQDMTPEYEEAVRAFQLADSKRSDQPGDVSQWPHYYSEFVDYFSGMNADLRYLDEDAFWTKDLSEDRQSLIVTLTRADVILTLSYSLQTSQITEVSTRRDVVMQSATDASVTVEHITLLNSYLEEDLRTLKGLNIPQEEYQDGYYRKDTGEIYTYDVDTSAPVTIYDISQEYGAGEDRLYTFETWKDFVTAAQANEALLVQPYTLTIQDGIVTKIVEKFYN